jgi:hypothetical protein
MRNRQAKMLGWRLPAARAHPYNDPPPEGG